MHVYKFKNNMINTNKPHILVADDDNRIRGLLVKFFTEKNFTVSQACNAAEVRDLVKYFTFDLLVLDVMMPGESGISLASFLRKESQVPIIFLTAMGDIDDKISGLETGADDYLVKPFEPRELILRVERIIDRTKEKTSKNIVNFGNYKFDLETLRLQFKDKNIILTFSESKLLSILISNAGKIMDRSILALECGGVNERSIDVQIIRLRNKIEEDPKAPFYIQTIRNKGYVFYLT